MSNDSTPYHPNHRQQDQVNASQGVTDGAPDARTSDSIDRGIKTGPDADMGSGADVVGPDERPIEDHYAPEEDESAQP